MDDGSDGFKNLDGEGICGIFFSRKPRQIEENFRQVGILTSVPSPPYGYVLDPTLRNNALTLNWTGFISNEHG